MGPLSGLLALPVAGPIGGLVWLARQVAENAVRQMLDPARIEAALLGLERKLEAGDIDEAAFEAAESLLLEELAEMRAARAELAGEADTPLADVDPAYSEPSVVDR